MNAEPPTRRRVPAAPVAVALGLGIWGVLWLFGRSSSVVPSPVPQGASSDARKSGAPPTFSPASGWQVLTSEVAPASVTDEPGALAANVPIANRDRELSSANELTGTSTILSLPRGGVVILVTLPFGDGAPSPPHYGNWPDLQLPLQLSDAVVTRFSEPTRTRAWPQYEVQGRVAGTYVTATAYFGAPHPSSATIAAAQAELDRLRLPALPPGSAPPPARWTTNDAGSLTIQTPPGWTFSANPSSPIVLAEGNWPIPGGGSCGPDAALSSMPRDGALLWLSETVLGPQEGGFPPRPARFTLEGRRPVSRECSGNSYLIQFRDHGRAFQAQIVFGLDASAATRSRTLRSLSSLRVGSGPG